MTPLPLFGRDRSPARPCVPNPFGLETYSPYLDKDLTDCRIFDSGDLELCFGDANLALNHIESRAAEILEAGKLPVMIGGEHLVTLGAVRAAVKRYPDLHVVHFDAHADLRDDYLGAGCPTPQCSAGSGIGGRRPDFSIRHPVGDREEFLWGREHVFTRRFDFKGLEETVAALQKSPFTLPWIWTCWTRLSFPAPEPRKRRRQLPGSAGSGPQGQRPEHRGLRCQRAVPGLRPKRRFHRRGLQGAPGAAASAFQIAGGNVLWKLCQRALSPLTRRPCMERRPRLSEGPIYDIITSWS